MTAIGFALFILGILIGAMNAAVGTGQNWLDGVGGLMIALGTILMVIGIGIWLWHVMP